MASEKQINFFNTLLVERDFSGSDAPVEVLRARFANLEMRDASRWIEKALKLPRLEKDRRIDDRMPSGRYALMRPKDKDNPVHFYKITHGRSKTFVDRYASDELFIVIEPTRSQVLDEVAKDPQTASALYGQYTTRCGICGRKLTRVESRERGIGPICAAAVGW